MAFKQERLILFTSLPRVGGHTTITLGLCELLKPHFRELEVWCRTMPDHGFSASATQQLESMGCTVKLLADERGKLNKWKVIKLLMHNLNRPGTRLFVIAMGYLSFVFALLVAGRRSLYYHISHDLNAGTLRRLNLCRLVFEKLVFISPATYHDFSIKSSRQDKISWAAQCSEMPTPSVEVLTAERAAALSDNPPIRFGVIGRLTEQKGAGEILRFIDKNQSRCEFHIAGNGPFAEEFKKRQENPLKESRIKVHFYGAYDPTGRVHFLRNFFSQVDWLIVPTLDEWETLCMALLEGLQHGVPCIATLTGGLKSFGMPELGPAPQPVVRLIEPSRLFAVLEEVAGSPRSPTVSACLNYYAEFFSDKAVGKRWLELADCAGDVV